jgi:hypothetical protein
MALVDQQRLKLDGHARFTLRGRRGASSRPIACRRRASRAKQQLNGFAHQVSAILALLQHRVDAHEGPGTEASHHFLVPSSLSAHAR